MRVRTIASLNGTAARFANGLVTLPNGHEFPPPQLLQNDTVGTVAKFLKLDDEALKQVLGGFGSAVSLASGMVGVGGAVFGAMELYEKFFGGGGEIKQVLKALDQIQAKLDGLYTYFELRELEQQRRARDRWNGVCARAESTLNTVRRSRSSADLEALTQELKNLHDILLEMLSVDKIPYNRNTYTSVDAAAGQWVDAARPPWLRRADKGEIKLVTNLADRIWDAGWFLAVLGRALILFPIVMRMVEPGARSTEWERGLVVNLRQHLATFLANWENSIIVSDPAAWINPGGRMSSPFERAPVFIAVGAVDPTSGISMLDLGWGLGQMKIESGFDWSISASGVPDWTRVLNPDEALHAAIVRQSALHFELKKACGIYKLAELERTLGEYLSHFEGSDFVVLPDAKFKLLSPIERGDSGVRPQITDGLARYFRPRRDYAGTRFYQETEKRIVFDIARRADRSQIQLGYRLKIGGMVIDLVEFTAAPAIGTPVEIFPEQTIQRSLSGPLEVFDCFQAAAMSAAQEDTFEQEGSVAGVPRAFVNGRPGDVALDLQIKLSFDPFGASPNAAGRVELAIANRSPREFPGAIALDVQVLEKRYRFDSLSDQIGHVEWGVADQLTVHMVPSFVIIDRDFFEDLDAAFHAMLRDIKGLQDRFTLQDLIDQGIPIGPEPEPDPRWRAIWFDRSAQWATNFMHAAERAFPVEFAQELARRQVPTL
ncbi:hypothetical protein GCM10007276_20930 [Agaricicola taiwanensis]|uniref:Uncharacterized protein n=1 Tax=Agaricicola taiwanensis TaxID=591372 RepID=A0A8J3DUM7_9RHOB|nr:hypothetical protein [Agaricicola taiwanensis]GGE43536.1 hypothetical protein GCM10007276_20930 [Agaricicola taiwanensis]